MDLKVTSYTFAAWLSFTMFALYVLAVVIYRLRYHPLANVPGPRLASITDLWELWQDFFRKEGGYLYIELDQLHERYGPVVRIRPNEVHVRDSEWMDVLYTGSSNPRDRDPFVAHALGVPNATIGAVSAELHRQRKAAISPWFSARSIQAMEKTLQEDTTKLVKNLEAQKGQVVNLRAYILAWTTDFITAAMFGESTDLFWKPERANDRLKVMTDFSRVFPLIKHQPWIVTASLEIPLFVYKLLSRPLWQYASLNKDLLALANKASQNYHSHDKSSKLGKEKAASPRATTGNMLETLLSSDLPEAEKAPKRMTNEMCNLMIAGSLSTSKACVAAIFYILNDEEVLSRLQAELIEAIPDPSNRPSSRALKQLPFLTAVIKEAMRLSCVVTTRNPMILRRKAECYGDFIFPPGTSVSMTASKSGLDAKIFADPYAFNPQRWENGMQKPFDYERYVIPFGRGTRSCIGKELAYTQLYVILGAVFRSLDLQLYDTKRERDVDNYGGGPLGEPRKASRGVRVLVQGVRHTG